MTDVDGNGVARAPGAEPTFPAPAGPVIVVDSLEAAEAALALFERRAPVLADLSPEELTAVAWASASRALGRAVRTHHGSLRRAFD